MDAVVPQVTARGYAVSIYRVRLSPLTNISTAISAYWYVLLKSCTINVRLSRVDHHSLDCNEYVPFYLHLAT